MKPVNPIYLSSVHHDGSARYILQPAGPDLQIGDQVTIRLRTAPDAPVEHLLLRTCPDGEQFFVGRFNGNSADFLRDSTGRMRNSWSCYDAERGLVYFGVYVNRLFSSVTYRGNVYDWFNAPDEPKGRFPCDFVLVLSVSTRSWSVWLPPQGILWTFTGPDFAGKQRVYFVGEDKRVYGLEDSFAHYNRDPFKTTVSISNTGPSNTILVTDAFGDNATSLGTADNHIRVGMNIMVLDGVGPEIKAVGTITGYDVVAKSIGLSVIGTFLAGDVVIFGHHCPYEKVKTG